MTLYFLKTLNDVHVNEDSADFVNIACFEGGRYIPLMSALPAKYNSSQPSMTASWMPLSEMEAEFPVPSAMPQTVAMQSITLSQLNSIDSLTHFKVHYFVILFCLPVSFIFLLLQVGPSIAFLSSGNVKLGTNHSCLATSN